jgi:hypothetical protein
MQMSHKNWVQYCGLMIAGAYSGTIFAAGAPIPILGAYFPSWMLVALLALPVTLIFIWLLNRMGLAQRLVLRGLVYLSVYSLSAIAIWLLFFAD